MTADIYNEDWVTFGPLAIELQCMRSRTNSKFDMHASEPEHCSCKLRHPHGSRKLPRIETELPQRATGGVRTEQAQDRRLRPLWRCPAYFKQRNLGATGTHPGHKCKSRARALRAPRARPWPRAVRRVHHRCWREQCRAQAPIARVQSPSALLKPARERPRVERGDQKNEARDESGR